MAETRRWEDLPADCLIDIFARLDTETVAESVQHVCRSWYQITLNPQCWQNLYFSRNRCSDAFVQFAIARSQNSATSVTLQALALESEDFWWFIARGCPLLEILDIPIECRHQWLISELIENWKNLECIELSSFEHFAQILESISLHCPNFKGLVVPGLHIDEEEAELIVQYVPKIKILDMNGCFLHGSGIRKILNGCRELEVLDVSDCFGFDENDEEILKLASHIKSFNCRGAAVDMVYE